MENIVMNLHQGVRTGIAHILIYVQETENVRRENVNAMMVCTRIII